MPTTIVALVEDNPSIRENLSILLNANKDFEVAQTASSIEDFVAEADQFQRPDILVLDIGLPGKSGIEGIADIKAIHPDVDIMMLTTYEESEMVFKALCAGASSYVSKRMSMVKIIKALETVANGGSYMSPSIARHVMQHFQRKQSSKLSSDKLSDRQLEIAKYASEGLSYKQIAEKCFISVNTVHTHIKRIYNILDIKSKVDLANKFRDGDL